MKHLIFYCFLGISLSLISQVKNDSIRIRGVGSYYKNAPIEVYKIDDYISFKEVLLERKMVDSTGYFEFNLKKLNTQKIILRSKKNSTSIYVQPGGNYLITIPEKNEYEAKNPTGNYVDVTFYQLDSNDINYKILNFERTLEKEIGDFYHLKKINPKEYEKRYVSLKKKLEKKVSKDTTSFFLYHVKFTFAEMDDLETVTARTRALKYKQCIEPYPIYYKSNMYMNYFSIYYSNLLENVKNDVKDKLYDAIIYRSPTLALKAFSKEDDMQNAKLAELALIKLMYDQSFEKRYPKTNLLFVLDSIRMKSKFSEHRKIASNLIERIIELKVGSRFPDFQLISTTGDTISNERLEGKHLYIHFYDPKNPDSKKEIQPLLKLYETYGEYVQFLTICLSENRSEDCKGFPWYTVCLNEEDEFIKACNIKTYSSYILLDATQIIIANPALKPIPSRDYETIEPVFFQIKRHITGERRRR